MKSFIVCTLALFSFSLSYSIDFGHYIRIKATDAMGQRDSVIFELVQGATIGLDSSLGEQDISQLPMNSNGLDLRIIQRNIVTRSDINDTSIKIWLDGYLKVLTFNNNYDFKREIRGIDDWNKFEHIYDFVISLHAINYPVIITIEDAVFDLDVPIIFYDSTNNMIDTLGGGLGNFIYPGDPPMTVCIVNNEAENHLIGFIPLLLTDVFEENQNNNPMPEPELIYPNPGTAIITFIDDDTTSEVTQDIQFSVFDEWGKFVTLYIFSDRAGSYDLDISGLSPGVYYVKQNVKLEVKKFVKL